MVEPRRTLVDFLRGLGLTGTHVGCEHGVCGACTVLVDGRSARASCFAVQADGARSRPSRACAAGRPEPAPAGVPRLPRVAVRLLHARACSSTTPSCSRAKPAPPRGDPRHARRQPLPLHRLPDDRRAVELAASAASARRATGCRAHRSAPSHSAPRWVGRPVPRERGSRAAHRPRRVHRRRRAAAHAPLRHPAEPARARPHRRRRHQRGRGAARASSRS